MEICLNELSLRAYHGFYEEERILGGEYVVNISVLVDDIKADITDELIDTVDYQKLFVIISEEMKVPSKLLEHVAGRIRERIMIFESVQSFQLEILKKNPPLGVHCESSAVKIGYSKAS